MNTKVLNPYRAETHSRPLGLWLTVVVAVTIGVIWYQGLRSVDAQTEATISQQIESASR